MRPLRRTVLSAVLCAALLGACGTDVPGAGTPGRQLLRVTEGDRELRVEARVAALLEGIMPSRSGRLGWQQPGRTRSIEVRMYASIAGGEAAELAVLTEQTVWERDQSEEQLGDMLLDRITVEQCRDPGASPRIAFRLRAGSGAPVLGAPSGFVGVFMLEQSIAPVRHVVEAEDCAGALARLPADASAWVRAELGGATPQPTIYRREVALRGSSMWLDEGASGSRAANGAAVVALAEGIALDAVITWSVHADEPWSIPFLRERTPVLAENPGLAGAVIAALVVPDDGSAIGDVSGDTLALIDHLPPAFASANVGPLAAALAQACGSAGQPGCDRGRLVAVGRLAARGPDRAACTLLADLTSTLARTLPPGEDRARSRSSLFREIHACSEVPAMGRAAVDLITGPFDYVSGVDPPMEAAHALAEACDADATRALIDAAPRATMHTREAIRCAVRRCAGPEAAVDVVGRMPTSTLPTGDAQRECWPTPPPAP